MSTRRGALPLVSAAIVLLIALAGCTPGESPSSAAPSWQLDSEMRGATKLCELAWKDTSRRLVIGHQRIPNVPELGYVYFLFRAPELITAPNMQ